MNKTSIVAVLMGLSVLAGLSAQAEANPYADEIGMYFDATGETVCLSTSPYVLFSAYLIISNPSAQDVWGIEFSMCTETSGGEGNLLYRINETWTAGFVDLGVVYDWCLDGRAIGFYEPVPYGGDIVILVHLQYMLLTDMSVEFYLGPHPFETIPDGLPAYVDGGGVVVPLQVSSGDPSLPVAAVNGPCNVVESESSTFSGLKCLYR